MPNFSREERKFHGKYYVFFHSLPILVERVVSFKEEQFFLLYPILKEEFEDTKGVIRNRISQKNRQHNGQKKKYKMTNNDLQNIHIKLKIE
jgi:hypothetical protein